MFADEDSRRVVLDALADDDFAADVEDVEDAADGRARRGVGQFLLAAAQPRDGLERGVLGGADKFKLQNALQIERAAEGR